MNVELEEGELESDENPEIEENLCQTKEEQAIDKIIKEAEVANMREKLLDQQKKKKQTVSKRRSQEFHQSPAKKRSSHGKSKTFDFPPVRFFNSEPLANLDHLLPPPPPPPPLPPIPRPENTDDYASVDMELEDDLTDIEVTHDMSSRKKDSLVSQNENRKRKHLDNELDELQRKVLSVMEKIEKETNSLDKSKRESEKLFNEQERIREKLRRNNLKIKCQKESVLKLFDEESKLRLRIRTLKCERIESMNNVKSPEYVENDENVWKEFDEQVELKKKERMSDEIEVVPRIVLEEVSEKVHISEQLEQKESISNEERNNYDDEMALREMLLQNMSKRKSSPPLKSTQVIIDPIEKGRKLLSQICKFDMNGICERDSCDFVHLSNVQVDERLLLESIFRYIFEYSDEDIGHAVTQTIAMKQQHPSTPFRIFVKNLLSNPMSSDEKLRGRFYTFFKQVI